MHIIQDDDGAWRRAPRYPNLHTYVRCFVIGLLIGVTIFLCFYPTDADGSERAWNGPIGSNE